MQKPEHYPSSHNVIGQIVIELNKYGLPADFYPSAPCSWQMWANLILSTKYYIPIADKIQSEIVDKGIRDLNEEENLKLFY